MAKILLVEDDNNLREIYQARLMAEGYDIVAAMNGEEALVIAKKENPDLVISDVMMPQISGFEMLDIMRNTPDLKHFKVIMLTALGQAEDKQRADSLGADRYLVKSQVTLEDIVTAAHELLDTEPAAIEAQEAQPAAPAATAPTPAVTPAAPVQVAPMPVQAPSAPAQPVPQPQASFTPPAPVATPTPDMPAAPAQAAPVAPAAAQPAPNILNDASSVSEEEKLIQDQIDSYTQQAATAENATAPAATAPTPTDDVMAKALQDLGGAPAPQAPESPAPAPTQAAPVAPAPANNDDDDNVTVAHKKIISPINAPEVAKPNIHELLAKEGLNLGEQSPANPDEQPPAMPPTPSGSAHVPGQTISPQGIDPSSIAL